MVGTDVAAATAAGGVAWRGEAKGMLRVLGGTEQKGSWKPRAA